MDLFGYVSTDCCILSVAGDPVLLPEHRVALDEPARRRRRRQSARRRQHLQQDGEDGAPRRHPQDHPQPTQQVRTRRCVRENPPVQMLH